MPGPQLGVPSAVAVRRDGDDLAVAHLADADPAGDHVTGGRVLGLDVLGHEAGVRRDGAYDVDVDRAFGDRPQLLAERLPGSFELEAPVRRQQVVEGVVGEQVAARREVTEAAVELGGQRIGRRGRAVAV